MCPVNSQNEKKLAGQGEARLRLLTNATYPRPGGGHASVHSCRLPEAYTVVTNMRSTIIVRLHEEAKSQAQGLVVRVVLLLEPHSGASVLLVFLISDKVHIYSGEGRKTAAQHVMMISINHARIYLGLRASPSVCSRSSSLSRNGGLAILPSIEIGLLTLRSHMSVICQEEVR